MVLHRVGVQVVPLETEITKIVETMVQTAIWQMAQRLHYRIRM